MSMSMNKNLRDLPLSAAIPLQCSLQALDQQFSYKFMLLSMPLSASSAFDLCPIPSHTARDTPMPLIIGVGWIAFAVELCCAGNEDQGGQVYSNVHSYIHTRTK